MTKTGWNTGATPEKAKEVVDRHTRRRPLAYSHSFDGKQWIVTEEFVSGYTVIGEFTTQADAQNYIETISNGGRR